MRYIITEEQLDKFNQIIYDDIDYNLSDLRMESKVVSLAAGIFFYVWYKKDSGEFVWEYIDEGYGLNEDIYNMLQKTYNLSHEKMDEFLKIWLKSNMPFKFNEIYTVEMD